jgi:hypothetical protein
MLVLLHNVRCRKNVRAGLDPKRKPPNIRENDKKRQGSYNRNRRSQNKGSEKKKIKQMSIVKNNLR